MYLLAPPSPRHEGNIGQAPETLYVADNGLARVDEGEGQKELREDGP